MKKKILLADRNYRQYVDENCLWTLHQLSLNFVMLLLKIHEYFLKRGTINIFKNFKKYF